MNQEGETGLPPPAYIAVTQGECQKGLEGEKGWEAGRKEQREGGKQDEQRRIGEKEETRTEDRGRAFPLELKKADSSSFSITIGAASEHSQEFRPRTVHSFH